VTGWFISGTDTEVGKTHVTAGLAHALRLQGRTVCALKPLATGEGPPGSDASLIGEAAGHEPRIHTCLPTPAAPDRAAHIAGTVIDPPALLEWIRAQGEPQDTMLIEGVGGWTVPITSQYRISDLARDLQLPIIVVAANRLGVLNHAVLTVEAIEGLGLKVAALVLNDHFALDPNLAEWNHEDLQRLLEHHCPVIRWSGSDLDADRLLAAL